MHRSSHLSPIWRPYAEAARDLGYRLTEAALGPGRSGSRLDNLVRRLQKELDRMIERAFDALPGDGKPACAPGCDHCCRTLRVTVSPIEVFTIIHRLREAHAPNPELEARLAAPLTGSLRPCPLLDDGTCLVYSSRPLACRGCVSGDASLCAACDDDRPVPRSTAHQLGAAAMLKGVTDSLDALGLVGRPVELREGLAAAVREKDMEKRWLRGKDVFPRGSVGRVTGQSDAHIYATEQDGWSRE